MIEGSWIINRKLNRSPFRNAKQPVQLFLFMSNAAVAIPDEVVWNKIYFIRDQKVMLDRDLAELYGVETKVLKQAVRRNITRFPEDFMFEMSREELEDWRSQFVTSKEDRQGLRYMPFCFTEQGVKCCPTF